MTQGVPRLSPCGSSDSLQRPHDLDKDKQKRMMDSIFHFSACVMLASLVFVTILERYISVADQLLIHHICGDQLIDWCISGLVLFILCSELRWMHLNSLSRDVCIRLQTPGRDVLRSNETEKGSQCFWLEYICYRMITFTHTPVILISFSPWVSVCWLAVTGEDRLLMAVWLSDSLMLSGQSGSCHCSG